MISRKFLIYNVCALFFLGCSGQPSPDGGERLPPPSSNPALNAVSPTEHKAGYLQKSYDRWEKEEWEPATADSGTSEEASPRVSGAAAEPAVETDVPAEEKTSTLQRYVDKWGKYLEESEEENKTSTPSHVEQLENMPGIGSGGR